MRCASGQSWISVHIGYPNSNTSASVHVQLATQIVASLLALEAGDEAQDIQLYINSQGKAAVDVMHYLRAILYLSHTKQIVLRVSDQYFQ